MMLTHEIELQHLLGTGAMGEVWAAHHHGLGCEVAVKLILEAAHEQYDDLPARLAIEATAAARIQSRHVVRIFEHGVTGDGTPYIVMERLHGVTLHDHLLERGRLEIDDVLRIVEQVGQALDAAHGIGVVHRDIKPHNIFLTDAHGELVVKVLDFGSAKLAAREATRRSYDRPTDPDVLVGSPAYLSRDLLLDPAAVDRRADLWALAVTAFKCLTGELPFRGVDVVATCNAILEGQLVRASRARPQLPPACDAWFARLFSVDAAARPQSGAAMVAGLAGLVAARTAPPPPERVTAFPRARRPRSSVVGLAIGVPLALAVVVAVGMMVQGGTVVPATLRAAAALDVEPAPGVSNHALAGVVEPAAQPRPVKGAPAAIAADLAARRVPVPAGPFTMGCAAEDDECADDEPRAHTVEVAAFRIDRTEVTVSDYARCVDDGVCEAAELGGYRLGDGPFVASPRCNWGHAERARHPLNCVAHAQADRYCRWAHGRLPSEAEWEKAARGSDGRRFPGGSPFVSCAVAAMSEGLPGCRAYGTMIAGSKLGGASPYGALDMAGNVREWVSGWYQGEAAGLRVGRGGSWGNAVGRFLRTSAREAIPAQDRSIHLGFRCASD